MFNNLRGVWQSPRACKCDKGTQDYQWETTTTREVCRNELYNKMLPIASVRGSYAAPCCRRLPNDFESIRHILKLYHANLMRPVSR
jgi:hypothetical protein